MTESRRAFLQRTEWLALGLLPGALPLLQGCARFNVVYSGVEGSRLVVTRESLGTAGFALVEAPGLTFPIYLYRHEGDRYSAVLTRCMHRGCQVEPADGHLVCPCHGSEYDNEGAILKGPTELPLIRYEVTADAENIYIDVSAGSGDAV